jgi:hypothetical protein
VGETAIVWSRKESWKRHQPPDEPMAREHRPGSKPHPPRSDRGVAAGAGRCDAAPLSNFGSVGCVRRLKNSTFLRFVKGAMACWVFRRIRFDEGCDFEGCDGVLDLSNELYTVTIIYFDFGSVVRRAASSLCRFAAAALALAAAVAATLAFASLSHAPASSAVVGVVLLEATP